MGNLGHKLLYKGGGGKGERRGGREEGEEREGKKRGGGEGGGRGNGGKFEYCNKWEATILAKFWLSSLD